MRPHVIYLPNLNFHLIFQQDLALSTPHTAGSHVGIHSCCVEKRRLCRTQSSPKYADLRAHDFSSSWVVLMYTFSACGTPPPSVRHLLRTSVRRPRAKSRAAIGGLKHCKLLVLNLVLVLQATILQYSRKVAYSPPSGPPGLFRQ